TKNTQEKGLVKFTQKYSKEAHSTCFELGLAPKLWASSHDSVTYMDENILVKYKNGEIDIKFVDFDWAGREGGAKYPESLNPTINWHLDVGWHKLIKREYDHHLVDNIYLDIMSDDEPSKKRRRLSEWMS
ncbi:5442_t:CDS:2, partial [Ambispora leptoticha]